MQSLSIISKLATVSLFTVAVAVTTGCATKRSDTSEVVVAPMGIPGSGGYKVPDNAVYDNVAGGAIVNNTAAIQQAAASIRGIVYFDFDSSSLDASAQNILDQQVEFLAANTDAKVLVAGHTDDRGSREYNHALGERRAKAVKSYLSAKGIPDVRVETLSYGEERPAVQGTTEEAYRQNRRAELSY